MNSHPLGYPWHLRYYWRGVRRYWTVKQLHGYNNGAQVITAKTANVVVSKPAATNETIGAGTISPSGKAVAAQVDQHGNVNVSRFGSRFAGVGGFVNISQNARRLVFCGTMKADGLEVVIENGIVRIVNEGRIAKFVKQVEQISFSGRDARIPSREILVVTELAVFRLQPEGVELIEVAPGIEIERDVVGQMEFRPIVRRVERMNLGLK